MRVLKTLLSTIVLSGMVWGQVHPGFDLATIHPNNWSPRVGGMDLLSDGRLVVAEWGVPHSVYIVENAKSATGNQIQVKEFAKGLDNVLGLTVVDDRIFVLQRQELTELVDTDNDGVADEYVNINDNFPTHEAMLNFAYDLEYTRGAFWVALSADVIVGGYTWGCETQSYCKNREPVAGRSSMWKLNWDGSSEEWAGGFRNPNGMGVGLGSEIFVTDNQGSWLPSSKIIHVKEGHFYGHRTNPANKYQSAGESPPLVWLTHGEVTLSAGKVIYLRSGRFAGQLLFTETVNNQGGRLQRVFMEEMNGEIQGAVMPFVKNGLEGGSQRVVQDADGVLYVGIHGSSGGWGARSGMTPGLQRLNDNNANVFELLAVRSLDGSRFELEFTQALGASGEQVGNYDVEKYQMIPTESYGGGSRQNTQALSVQSVSLNTDRTKATLTINGLQEDRVIHFDVGGVRSQTGNLAPFAGEAWYTLNNFGPGVPPNHTKAVNPKTTPRQWGIHIGSHEIKLSFSEKLLGEKKIAIVNMKGKIIREFITNQKFLAFKNREFTSGLYIIEVRGVNGVSSFQKIVIR